MIYYRYFLYKRLHPVIYITLLAVKCDSLFTTLYGKPSERLGRKATGATSSRGLTRNDMPASYEILPSRAEVDFLSLNTYLVLNLQLTFPWGGELFPTDYL